MVRQTTRQSRSVVQQVPDVTTDRGPNPTANFGAEAHTFVPQSTTLVFFFFIGGEGEYGERYGGPVSAHLQPVSLFRTN